MNIDFVYIVSVSAGAVGIIEYVKNCWKTAPTWAWRIVSPLAALGCAIAGGGGLYAVATNAIMILAVSQLCYTNLIKVIQAKAGA